ncbi:MAG: hypothetical protein AAF688_00690 [Bacteroidota bacterium]
MFIIEFRNTVLIFFLIISNLSFACECKTFPYSKEKNQEEFKLEDSFESSTIIFYGKFIGEGKFEVMKLFRGKELLPNQSFIEEKEELYNCDYSFKKNYDYLVFGNLDEHQKLWTSVCVSNRLIKNKSELKFVKDFLKKN